MSTKNSRRHNLVSEIYKHGKQMKTNIATLTFLLSTMNDKELTKFHKEFMEKPIAAKS